MPILFLITLIDLIGFGMIFPLMPMFKIKFALNDIEIGYIASIFAIFGAFGSIFWGKLSDKYGRTLPLALPLFVLAIIYHLTGRTDNLYMFILFRALAGFFASNFSVAFASAADMSDSSTRFKNIGKLSASFGLGFILGPSIGGWLAGNALNIEEVNFILPFDVAGSLNTLAGLIALFFFKETLTPEDRKAKTRLNIFLQLRKVFRKKQVQFFTIVMITFMSMMSGIQVFFGIFLNEKFLFSSQEIGWFWAVSGLCMTLIQLNISKVFTPRTALITGFSIYGLSVAFLLMAEHANSVILVIACFACMTIGGAMIMPSINARISLDGKKNQQGLIFGITQAISSLGRMIGPNLVGLLFHFSHNLAWACISVASFFLALLIMKVIKKEV
ncbi:MAG: MFS transporter [Alphaproteobacteria bacterium]|jgi:MFS family permease|nr:MFS transporter [Alphaproteobacteria bacterium]